jgi:hypothetical protein
MDAAATQTMSQRSADTLRAVPTAQALTVAAVYLLSEAGRKASLLAGGDGKGVQRLSVQVPSARLHLVSVDLQGTARLKLQPRFERVDGAVVRRDGPPSYDLPPSVEELFREAAKNYELEREFRAERSLSRDRRRDADAERRTQLATEFLSDPTQRAMVHPVPSAKRCFIATPSGRVMFDVAKDAGPARDVPHEAFRRFRADLRTRRERNLTLRAQHLALHEEKKKVIAEWVAQHGSADQRERHAEGLLPAEEVIAALTDEAFACVNDVPRYPLDGAVRLAQYLREVTARPTIVIAPADLQIVGTDAKAASATQWSVIQQLQARLPDAEVKLRDHRLSWRREPALPALSVCGVLATRHVGPFTLRREFAVPER